MQLGTASSHAGPAPFRDGRSLRGPTEDESRRPVRHVQGKIKQTRKLREMLWSSPEITRTTDGIVGLLVGGFFVVWLFFFFFFFAF